MCCTSNCFEPCVAASRERGTTRTRLCRKQGMSNNHLLEPLKWSTISVLYNGRCACECVSSGNNCFLLQEAPTSTRPNTFATLQSQNIVLWTALESNFFHRGDLTKGSTTTTGHNRLRQAIHNWASHWQVQEAAECSNCDLETGKLQTSCIGRFKAVPTLLKNIARGIMDPKIDSVTWT